MLTAMQRRELEKEDEFRKVKTVALEQLAKLLYIKPTSTSEFECNEWLNGQTRQLKTLDRALLRTTIRSAAQSLLNFSQAFDPKRERGALCPVHHCLNLDIVDTLMNLVMRECTLETDRYRHRRQKQCLNPLMSNWLIRVDEVSALWMGKERWEHRMRRGLSLDIPCCAASSCIACQLAVVGGSARFLTDLRASLLAREQYSREIYHRDVAMPCLSRMLDAWIAMCYPKEHPNTITAESDMLAGMVFAQRDQMRQERERYEQVTGMHYHPSTASDGTEKGLLLPRAVTQEEYERECVRRRYGEFYGERDSGWDWSLSGSGSGSGSESHPGQSLGAPGPPIEHRWPFLNSSQGSHATTKMNADPCTSGSGSRVAELAQQSRPTLREQLQFSRQRLFQQPAFRTEEEESPAESANRLDVFTSWAASVAVHHPEYKSDDDHATAQPQASADEATSFVRDGDVRRYVQMGHFDAPEPCSAEIVGPESPFTVSPVSPQGTVPPATAPSSRYSANPGPPPSTAVSVPPAFDRVLYNRVGPSLQRGARNRERTPPRRRLSNGTDDAVDGDVEVEYWSVPQRLGSRRFHRQYREQIQPTRPLQQEARETIGNGQRPALEAVDAVTASCYTTMGWGGRTT